MKEEVCLMNELIKEIEYNNGKLPEVQLKEIIKRKEEFIPELLEILKNAKENWDVLKTAHEGDEVTKITKRETIKGELGRFMLNLKALL